VAKILALGTVGNSADITLKSFLFDVELIKGKNVGANFFILNLFFSIQDSFDLFIHQSWMDIASHGWWFIENWSSIRVEETFAVEYFDGWVFGLFVFFPDRGEDKTQFSGVNLV
jgi:hypothetical protein